LVASERKITAEVVEYIREIDSRRAFSELGYTSTFAFLTEAHGYTAGAAQRRIDAARLLKEMPEIKEQLKTGELNLMQMTCLAHAVREKEKTSSCKVGLDEKRKIIDAVKGKELSSSQFTIYDMLDIEPKKMEIKKIQKDESTRIEMTFSKEESQILQEVKDSLSHVMPGASVSEILIYLSKQHLKNKKTQPKATAKMEVKRDDATTSKLEVNYEVKGKSDNPHYVRASIKREVREEQTCCQWKHKNGRMCGSTFQLQADHRQSIWAGGSSEKVNLQTLCSFHNRMKYMSEAGIRYVT
jgi:hypothetical protein